MLQSTNIVYTIFPGTSTSWSRSIISDSLIPLSTTLASSTTSSSGGPGSTYGDAVGSTSADTMSAPLFSRPSKGSPVSTLIPAITSVSPNFTLAEPLAFFITSTSISRGLCSVKSLPSSLLPLASASHICCLRRCSTIIVDRFEELILLYFLLHFSLVAKILLH